MRPFVFLLLPLLAGCDAWPTIVTNKTNAPVMVRYLHRDYDHWSAEFPISAGKAMPLGQEHWIQDIRAVAIRDGRRSYAVSGATLQRVQDTCLSTEAARRFLTAGNCYLIYLGDGRLQTMAVEPKGLEVEQIGNGG